MSGPAVCERQGDATLGVKTARGDFERALVADIQRAVERIGCPCWACARREGAAAAAADGMHRLMAVEDVRRFLDK